MSLDIIPDFCSVIVLVSSFSSGYFNHYSADLNLVFKNVVDNSNIPTKRIKIAFRLVITLCIMILMCKIEADFSLR